MSWATGDFNGDGKVDVNDLTVVLSHFSQMLGRPSRHGRRARADGLAAFGPRAARAAAVARREITVVPEGFSGFGVIIPAFWRRRLGS